MLDVLAIVTPVFALMAFGYLTARLRYLPDGAGAALAQFAFKIALPAMLFRALLTSAPMQASPARLLGAYLLAVMAVWLTAVLAAAVLLGRRAEDQVPLAMASTFGNTVMLGLPIGVMALGPEATSVLALLIAVEAPLLWIVATLHMECARRGRDLSPAAFGGVAKELATNPVILSLVLGVACRAAGLELPAVPDRILGLIGQAGVPTALFALGMVLASFGSGGEKPTLGVIFALKLVALPVLAYVLAAHVFTLPPLYVAAVTLHAAMPVGANAFLFVSRYERGAGTVSAAIVASTLIGVATVSTLLLWLGPTATR